MTAMDFLLSSGFLLSVQAISSIVMMVLILMQSQGVGLSGAFGGEGGFYRSRRGLEKGIFNFTIILAALYLVTSFLYLYAQ